MKKTIADAFSPEVLVVRYSNENDCRLDIDGNTSSQTMAEASVAQAEALKMDLQPDIYSSEKVTLQPFNVEITFASTSMESSSTKTLMTEYDGKSGIWVIL